MKHCLTQSARVSFAKVTSIMTVLLALATAAQAAPTPNPLILPPGATPYGKTYGQWAGAWWQWALGVPAESNPVLDETGAFAGVNQSGPVWFLAGTFGNSVERTATIPAGKAIFMPIHNWIFGSGVFDCEPTVPGVTCDVPELQMKAAIAATNAEVVEAWIDGVAVKNVRDYRAFSSEPFSITLPEGAVFGLEPGAYFPQVADGYWLMLAPLKPGTHTITVHAVNSAYGIDATIKYDLTVK